MSLMGVEYSLEIDNSRRVVSGANGSVKVQPGGRESVRFLLSRSVAFVIFTLLLEPPI